MKIQKPRIAVWKFASCDGCQLTLLDCEDELLDIADAVQITNFPEASRAVDTGNVEISFVEGSITTPEDEERIRLVRKKSGLVITIGACATAGGIQALRNFQDVDEFVAAVYARPDYISTLTHSRPIVDYIQVDFELRGCPISKVQLIETISSLLQGRKPNTPSTSVCVECKRKGQVCIMVAGGIPCLGPVTQAGCNAICPGYLRGCYGCFGPKETPNTHSLSQQWKLLGSDSGHLLRSFRSFNAFSEPFRQESEAHEHPDDSR